MFSIYLRNTKDKKPSWCKISRTAAWFASKEAAEERAQECSALYPHIQYEVRKDQ